MYRNVFWRGGSVSWKKDIIDDMKQRHRGGSHNYPGPDADHPYLRTAHLSCRELDAISEVQFTGDQTDAALQREQHYKELRDKSECLGVGIPPRRVNR